MPKGQTTSSAPIIKYCYDLREGLKTLISSTPTNNHYRSLREGLKILTSSTPTNNNCRGLREELKTQISSAPINKYYCGLKEGLETHLVSITSTSFVSGSDTPEVILSCIKLAIMGYTLWRGYCRRSGIKDSTPAACSLCEYIWEVILYMVLTGK